MKVFSATDIQVAAKDTIFQSVEHPLDMQVGVQADRLNLMVLSGAVRDGAVTIRGAEDTSVRTYTANGHSLRHEYSYPYSGLYSNFYIYLSCMGIPEREASFRPRCSIPHTPAIGRSKLSRR